MAQALNAVSIDQDALTILLAAGRVILKAGYHERANPDERIVQQRYLAGLVTAITLAEQALNLDKVRVLDLGPGND